MYEIHEKYNRESQNMRPSPWEITYSSSFCVSWEIFLISSVQHNENTISKPFDATEFTKLVV